MYGLKARMEGWLFEVLPRQGACNIHIIIPNLDVEITMNQTDPSDNALGSCTDL